MVLEEYRLVGGKGMGYCVATKFIYNLFVVLTEEIEMVGGDMCE